MNDVIECVIEDIVHLDSRERLRSEIGNLKAVESDIRITETHQFSDRTVLKGSFYRSVRLSHLLWYRGNVETNANAIKKKKKKKEEEER